MILRHKETCNYAWAIVIFILFFQSVLQKFSLISNIALLVIALLQFSKMGRDRTAFMVNSMFYILLLIGYSVLLGNEMSLVLRFAIILTFIIAAYLWRSDYTFYFKALFYISFTLVLALFCLEVFLFYIPTEEYKILRNTFFLENNMGDVFWWGVYYKLELRGTPLIVFVYMLSYVANIFPYRFRKILRCLYFIATIIAGNFAYQLALVIFHLFYYIYCSLKTPQLFVKRMFGLFVLLLVTGGILLAYISSQMETKKEGSTQARIDQAEVLCNDMASSPITMLFGSGLGHTIEVKTQERDYRGATYYEVQTLYIFNQLGFVNFTILILLNIILAFRYIRQKELLLVYGVYVLYASTNPYIWDTNHVVVITSLLCARAQNISARTGLQTIIAK